MAVARPAEHRDARIECPRRVANLIGRRGAMYMGVRLEDVTPGALVGGVAGDGAVTVVAVRWIGSNALQLTYRTEDGRLDERLLYRDHERRLTLRQAAAAYDFSADGAMFKLAAEALRIRMAARFDPMLGVHTSNLEPLPHQIE